MPFVAVLPVRHGRATLNLEAEVGSTCVVHFEVPTERAVSSPTCVMSEVRDAPSGFDFATVAPVVTDDNDRTVTLTWSTTKLAIIAASLASKVAYKVLDDDDETVVEGTLTVLADWAQSPMQRPEPVVTVTVEDA